MTVACPLCAGTDSTLHAHAEDVEYFTSDTRYELRHCPRCDVLFVNPMLHDRLSFIYPPNYYSFQAGKKNAVVAIKEWLDRRYFAKLTKSIPGDELAVLDVGGGTGWLIGQLTAADPRFRRSVIVDIDAGAEAVARAAGHEYHLGPFEEFPATGRGFDLILMLNLIEHVPNPRVALEKAAALLRPGGRLVIKTPNVESLDARLFRHRSWGGFHTPRHFVLFNRKSFERLAAEAGLEIAAFSYTQGAPFWAVSILDALRRAGLVRVDAARPSIYHPLTPLLQGAMAAFDFARMLLGGKPSQMVFVLSLGEPRATA